MRQLKLLMNQFVYCVKSRIIPNVTVIGKVSIVKIVI